MTANISFERDVCYAGAPHTPLMLRQGKNMKIISRIDDLYSLEDKYKDLELKSMNPKYGQKFMLWRGAKKHYELLTSLQVYLKNEKGNDWKATIRGYEKKSLEKFSKIVASEIDLKRQYSWYDPEKHNSDTVWYLSIMQHYGFPTRFLDFTANFWTAVFFATDGASKNNDMILYSLNCKNENKDNRGGNKLPKDSEGNPWTNNIGKVDINDFLGNIIGYGSFAQNTKQLNKWKKPKQAFGWDKPTLQNARIREQKGFLVYPVHVTQSLEEILTNNTDNTEFNKYRISGKLLPKIRQILIGKRISSWAVYLDLERALKNIKEDIV